MAEYTTQMKKVLITTYTCDLLRQYIKVHDIVRAEIWHPNDKSSNSSGLGRDVVEKVEIWDKYPYIAITNRGSVSWVNIAIHNQDLIRKAIGEERWL